MSGFSVLHKQSPASVTVCALYIKCAKLYLLPKQYHNKPHRSTMGLGTAFQPYIVLLDTYTYYITPSHFLAFICYYGGSLFLLYCNSFG